MIAWRASLRTKTLLFASLCVGVPLLSLGGYLLKQNEQVLAAKVRATQSDLLFRSATAIEEWSGQRGRDVRNWAFSFVVFEGLEALSRGGNSQQRARREMQEYVDWLRSHHSVYESLFVADVQGAVLVSTREGEGLEGLDVLPPAVGRSLLGPVRRSSRLGRPTLVVTEAIVGRGDEPRGYFAGRVNLGELEILLQTGDPDTTLWLLDADGRVLARGGHVLDEPGREPFPTFSPGGQMRGEPLGEANLPGLGPTVYGLRHLTWPTKGYLAATVPSAVAYRSLAESRSGLLKSCGMGLLLVIVFNYVMAGRLLRSVHLLSRAAERMSLGDLDVFLPVRGSDEIAALTRSFNEMTRRVRESRDELAQANEDLWDVNSRLEAMAITDGLTGLYNHRHFYETLDKEMRRSGRDGSALSLLLLDLDHFKRYNDRFGHTAGDGALRRVAGTIAGSIRMSDIACRYGGEEFGILLPSCSKAQAAEVGEKIRAAIGSAEPAPNEGGPITVSVGLATYPEDGQAPRALVNSADEALYAAKAQGRNRVVLARVALPKKGRGSRRPTLAPAAVGTGDS